MNRVSHTTTPLHGTTFAEELTQWCQEHMTVSADGRYYATPEMAAQLQTFLRTRGFDGAVVTVNSEGRFEVEREPT